MMRAALLIVALVVLAGCVDQTQRPGGEPQSGSQDGNLYAPPSGNTGIDITSPSHGEVIDGTIVTVKVNVTNFKLSAIVANPVKRVNDGHIHYFIDGKEQRSNLKVTSFSGVQPGNHMLRAELYNNDHTPLVPPVFDTVPITVE